MREKGNQLIKERDIAVMAKALGVTSEHLKGLHDDDGLDELLDLDLDLDSDDVEEPVQQEEVEPEVEPDFEIDETANGISVFNFDQNKIRTVVDDDGGIWFVAKDVAESLGYRNAPDMTRILDEDEVSDTQMCVAGQNRKISLVSESGVFHATFSSKKTEAKRFRRWVTEEVLPTIRKTGKYEVPPQQERPALSKMREIQDDFAVGIEMAKMFGLDGNRAILKANNLVREVTSVDVLEKMDVSYLVADTQARPLTPTQIGKDYDKTAQQINTILKEQGFHAVTL